MRHPDLKGSPAAKATPLAELADALTRLAITDEMGMRQVQTLLVEPLVSLLDETEGLSGAGRLQEAFRSTSAEYYDALNEYLSLEGDGASAIAARAHAKTTAKATAEMGSAVMSQVGSRLGAGFGLLSRRVNQQLGELSGGAISLPGAASHPAGGPPPGAEPLAVTSEEGEPDPRRQHSVGTAAREALAGLQSGRSALDDAQANWHGGM
jgi:hypothetical protein